MNPSLSTFISTRLAFVLVSFSLGQLGDGLNIFQGIYLVGVGWKEGAVGTALSLMGLTSLLVQPLAGQWVDATTLDRRWFLVLAATCTALSASTVLLVHTNALHYALIFTSKVIEGVASSFIGPCLAALTLGTFGPTDFDQVMASNVYWGHVGSVVAALLAGLVAYLSFPQVQYCFLVIGASALVAIAFVPYLPQGNPLWGRGLDDTKNELGTASFETDESSSEEEGVVNEATSLTGKKPKEPQVTSYWLVLSDPKTFILCWTGFFFHFANANVLLVLGELMGQGGDEQKGMNRTAIPWTASAIVMAQLVMAAATYIAGSATNQGYGRKPLFLVALLSLPVRCALIIALAGGHAKWLVATQFLDGVGGGFFGLIHPYIVADITFGTGRFNAVMGLTASAFGLGATLSNYLGQQVVQHFGHLTSLWASLILSIVPIVLFTLRMPETLGKRSGVKTEIVV